MYLKLMDLISSNVSNLYIIVNKSMIYESVFYEAT